MGTTVRSGGVMGDRRQAAQAPTVLVPLDGSRGALAALPVARALAEIVGGMVRMLHVGSGPSGAELRQKLKLEIEDLRGSVLENVQGDPAKAIIQGVGERRSVAVVMCTHTGAPKPDPGLGSVAEAVLHAGVPLVLVRPDWHETDWRLRDVLIPYDGAPETAAALGFAASLAHRAQASLHILHVTGLARHDSDRPGTMSAPMYLDQAQHEWMSWSHEFLERLRVLSGLPEQTRMQLHLAVGAPGFEIVRFASEHRTDLIVLAWRGRFDAERAATFRTVLAQAPCPIFVLPTPMAGKDSWVFGAGAFPTA